MSIQKSYVVFIYVQHTNILFRYKVLVSPRLAHTHVPPTFTPHTKGKTTIPMGRARSARPIGTVVGAREARAHLCVV